MNKLPSELVIQIFLECYASQYVYESEGDLMWWIAVEGRRLPPTRTSLALTSRSLRDVVATWYYGTFAFNYISPAQGSHRLLAELAGELVSGAKPKKLETSNIGIQLHTDVLWQQGQEHPLKLTEDPPGHDLEYWLDALGPRYRSRLRKLHLQMYASELACLRLRLLLIPGSSC